MINYSREHGNGLCIKVIVVTINCNRRLPIHPTSLLCNRFKHYNIFCYMIAAALLASAVLEIPIYDFIKI